ncbi:MAG TPA: PEP-CTERM sorting domain-containing protein [Terriglobales bacterium]|nr:PEP-CTERM sorting domain-containing protein [Terriglobales bacterium]
MRKALILLVAALLLSVGAQIAAADTISVLVTGTISSPSVAPEDPNFQAAQPGDPWALALTYNQGDYTGTGPFTFTAASVSFSLDSNTMNFTAPTDTMTMSNPGPDGAGTTFFQVCITGDCANTGYLNLYFSGNVLNPDDTAGLSALTADNSASPSPFELLYNFPTTGDQTDLQGSIASISAFVLPPVNGNPVPEPASFWLLAGGLGLAALVETRRRARSQS